MWRKIDLSRLRAAQRLEPSHLLTSWKPNQEVQRRREVAIATQRFVEQEQFKLSMFLWENNAPMNPPLERAPDFPFADVSADP